MPLLKIRKARTVAHSFRIEPPESFDELTLDQWRLDDLVPEVNE